MRKPKISNEDKVELQELFHQMTLKQIMDYTKYFAPVPIVKETIQVGVKSSDKVYLQVWGKNIDEIRKSVERYMRVAAIL